MLALFLFQVAAAQVAPPRVEATVTVDGFLDEEVWGQAARLEGITQYSPADGHPAVQPTLVLVWYSPTALHFGIRAMAEPGTVRANLTERDRGIIPDDYIEIQLGTFNDGRSAYVFAVNPLRIQGTARWPELPGMVQVRNRVGADRAHLPSHGHAPVRGGDAVLIHYRRTDGSRVDGTVLPRLKLEYQVSRAIFLRFVGEYRALYQDDLRDDARTGHPVLIRDPADGVFKRALAQGWSSNTLRVDWLFSFQPTPGTVFFAGYGSSLAEEDSFRFRGLSRTGDGFFTKLSYLFRM